MTDEKKRRGEDERDEEDIDYTDAKAKQDEFEELAREEGFDKAAKDAPRGKKPAKWRPTTSHMP